MNQIDYTYKRALTHSEKITIDIISKMIAHTGFQVIYDKPLSHFINCKESDLTQAERNTYRKAPIDFVIIDKESHPVMAIEFDGPHHAHDLAQKKRDIRKNRVCHKLGMPLFRVGDEQTTEEDKISLLEFIVYRVVQWRLKRDEIVERVNTEIADMDDEQVAVLTEGGWLDPSIDPSFIYDYEHPFLGSLAVVEKLANDYDIECQLMHVKHVKVETPSFTLSFVQHSAWVTPLGTLEDTTICRLSEVDSKPEVIPKEGLIFQGKYSSQMELPISDDLLPDENYYDYRQRTGHSPVAHQWIPGLSSHSMGEHLSEYYALKSVEKWAVQNLRTITGI